MGKISRYMMLHFAVLLFSFTSVFAKSAANAYNHGGLTDRMFLLFCFLMILNCVVYAFFWQIVIKKVPLNVGYANRSVYLIWSQIWAVAFFGEVLTVKNIIGLAIVMIGVIVVSLSADSNEELPEEEGGAL
ncbi:MAG: EamA family transporter [Clostridia bacterium]|nr:EamA family transporter [Clostridia bacterium]